MTPEKHQLEQYRRDSERCLREYRERKMSKVYASLQKREKAISVLLTVGFPLSAVSMFV